MSAQTAAEQRPRTAGHRHARPSGRASLGCAPSNPPRPAAGRLAPLRSGAPDLTPPTSRESEVRNPSTPFHQPKTKVKVKIKTRKSKSRSKSRSRSRSKSKSARVATSAIGTGQTSSGNDDSKGHRVKPVPMNTTANCTGQTCARADTCKLCPLAPGTAARAQPATLDTTRPSTCRTSRSRRPEPDIRHVAPRDKHPLRTWRTLSSGASGISLERACISCPVRIGHARDAACR